MQGSISEVGHDGQGIGAHLFGHGTDGLEGWGLGIPHQLEEGHLRGGQQASALSYALQPLCLSIVCSSATQSVWPWHVKQHVMRRHIYRRVEQRMLVARQHLWELTDMPTARSEMYFELVASTMRWTS